ncbi:Hypothetical protein PHPALM_5945 [Phytophthora palmivora]|uniref:Vps16 C-terminal domain-containing protein n=1 Tax=Phytophthora palmivora TaxID=4796 RepID=A0A2P4YG49_9STRA|nr:Hypothetical protein PHPALM_5945 [Phytophthora palmivora]
MGNVWSYYAGENDVFDKTARLASEAHACSAFYTSFRRSAAKVVLQQDASGSTLEREEVLLSLENWVSEASVLYDEDEEFPTTISMQQELVFDLRTPGDVTRHSANESVPATLEENILKGLSSNPLSTPDSIYKILVQLGKRLGGDEFLRVVGKYPRAARLFASQQLIARSDVSNTFQMNVLRRDFSEAAAVVSKTAYGDSVLETKRNRLKETSKLLKASLDISALSITSALSLSATDLHGLSVSRSTDSFNQVMTNEMLQLLETQRSMERALAIPAGLLVGSSLVETIQKLVTLHPVHRQALLLAVDCAEQFTVPPRQFWWTLLRVLARTDQYDTLLALAGIIRPPIGYVPVVEVILDDSKHDLARNLVEVIQDTNEREQVLALLNESEDSRSDMSDVDVDSKSAKPADIDSDAIDYELVKNPNTSNEIFTCICEKYKGAAFHGDPYFIQHNLMDIKYEEGSDLTEFFLKLENAMKAAPEATESVMTEGQKSIYLYTPCPSRGMTFSVSERVDGSISRTPESIATKNERTLMASEPPTPRTEYINNVCSSCNRPHHNICYCRDLQKDLRDGRTKAGTVVSANVAFKGNSKRDHPYRNTKNRNRGRNGGNNNDKKDKRNNDGGRSGRNDNSDKPRGYDQRKKRGCASVGGDSDSSDNRRKIYVMSATRPARSRSLLLSTHH